MQDLRLAIRALRAAPIVTAVAILSLALGIGANTAIFTLVDSLLLRTLPVRDPQQLALVTGGGIGPNNRFAFSYATLDAIRQHGQAFDGTLAYNCCGKTTLTIGGDNQIVDRMWVSGDFFRTLGISALLGRTITPEDDVPGGGPNGPVVVISYRLWQQRFAGAAGIVGQSVTIERIPVAVIGVAPPDFFGVEVGRTVDLLLPIRIEPLILPAIPFDDNVSYLALMLRLKPGQSLATGTAALRAVQPQIRAAAMPHGPAARPGDFLNTPFTLTSAGAGVSPLRQQFQRPLVVMLMVVIFVLVIACANIANLMLARGVARRYELAMRLALGASRWRLVRQFLVESILIASIGTSMALVFAAWASRAIVAQLSTSPVEVVLNLSPDWRMALFTAGSLIATTLLFGVAPALHATQIAPQDVLKEHGPIAADRSRLPHVLVVAQIALSLSLITVAGLFTRTFQHLAHVSLGLESDRILAITLTAPTVAAADRNPFYHRLVQAAAAVPGVAHAGGAILPPPLYPPMQDQLFVSVPGTELQSETERISRSNFITPGWLAALGTSLRSGRDIDEHDTTATPKVIVVNEAFVRRFFPTGHAIGGRVNLTFRFGLNAASPLGSWTVIGVVSDAVFVSIREPVPPTLYFPIAQFDDPIQNTNFYMIVQASSGSPLSLVRPVAAALSALNHDLMLIFRPMTDQVHTSLAQDRLIAWLSGFFGVLALFLAALGLFGVTAYAVARRRTEIGIRMALGAEPAGVIRLVMSRVTVLIGAGVVIGAGVSLWASKFVAPLLYGLEPRDPATMIGAALVLSAVGVLAGWLPAWRASRTDPAEVLREG